MALLVDDGTASDAELLAVNLHTPSPLFDAFPPLPLPLALSSDTTLRTGPNISEEVPLRTFQKGSEARVSFPARQVAFRELGFGPVVGARTHGSLLGQSAPHGLVDGAALCLPAEGLRLGAAAAGTFAAAAAAGGAPRPAEVDLVKAPNRAAVPVVHVVEAPSCLPMPSCWAVAEGCGVEGVGFAPDVAVACSPQALARRQDPPLEAAIQALLFPPPASSATARAHAAKVLPDLARLGRAPVDAAAVDAAAVDAAAVAAAAVDAAAVDAAAVAAAAVDAAAVDAAAVDAAAPLGSMETLSARELPRMSTPTRVSEVKEASMSAQSDKGDSESDGFESESDEES
jgi:hypothetical protein